MKGFYRLPHISRDKGKGISHSFLELAEKDEGISSFSIKSRFLGETLETLEKRTWKLYEAQRIMRPWL